MTTTDTRAALEAAIDAYATAAIANAGAALTDAWAAIAWAAISSAITAHVAAEVARALACADSVDEAIEAFDETSAAYGAAKRGFDLAARERAAAAQVASIDRLRAAITADKARAVTEVRAAVVGEAADRIVDAIAAEAARSLVAPAMAAMTRPTPNEARRLVDEFERLASIDEAYDQRDVARTALLRALGVEA